MNCDESDFTLSRVNYTWKNPFSQGRTNTHILILHGVNFCWELASSSPNLMCLY